MGGFITSWTDGAVVDALIMLDSSIQAKRAQQEGVRDLYSVLVPSNFPITFNDYFKRNRDGDTFRVTSDPAENETPNIATFAVKRFSAEKTALPR
jgi:hypothetical protein